MVRLFLALVLGAVAVGLVRGKDDVVDDDRTSYSFEDMSSSSEAGFSLVKFDTNKLLYKYFPNTFF